MLNRNKKNKIVSTKDIIDAWIKTVTPKKPNGSYRKAARMLGISPNTVKAHVLDYLDRKKKADENPGNPDHVHQLHSFIAQGKSRKKREYDQPKRTKELADYINYCLDVNEYNEFITGWDKQNLSGSQMFEEAEKLGFDVKYSTFMRFKKEIEEERRRLSLEEGEGQSHPRVYTIQNYKPGEVVEFDWGEIHINIRGELITAYAAVFAMPYSNYRIAYLYEKQDTASFIDAHNRFFEHIGGVPYVMVYDNMRIVRRYSGNGTVKELTDVANSMKTFLGYAIRLCNEHAGNEKSHVERAVAWTRNIGFKWQIDFDSLEEAEENLLIKTREYYESSKKITAEDRQKFQEDMAGLKYPFKNKFEWIKFQSRKVNKDSCVVLENVQYSVPEELTGQIVTLQIMGSDLRILHQGEVVAKHVITGEDSLDIRHLGNYFKKNPNALAGSDFYLRCPEAQDIRTNIFNGDFTILGAFLAENRHTPFHLFESRAKAFLPRYLKKQAEEQEKKEKGNTKGKKKKQEIKKPEMPRLGSGKTETKTEGGEEQTDDSSDEFKKRMEEYSDLFIK